MKRVLALVWVTLVVTAAAHLGYQAHKGIGLDTDLLALLPQDESDPAIRQAKAIISNDLSRQVLILAGHTEPLKARKAATKLAVGLDATGLFEKEPAAGTSGLEKLAGLYAPYRDGLLSDADRQRLQRGEGKAIADRALAQAFGLIGVGDAKLIQNDPFMLLPAFLASLPAPMPRVSVDDGMLTVQGDGKTWVLITRNLKSEAFALNVQDRLTSDLDKTISEIEAVEPETEFRRLGAVFFAHAGAKTGMSEATRISGIAITAVVLMIVFVFRAVGPLWQSLIAIGIGLVCGLSVTLLFFDRVHIVALIFGSTLIGTTVDYSLHFFCEAFGQEKSSSHQRLNHVLPALSLGALTTVIGYSILFLAPFPGLRQIAVFSVVGILASFATVILWLPFLDRRQSVNHGAKYLRVADGIWRFWERTDLRNIQIGILVVLAMLGAVGLAQISSLDDIRRMQTLSPVLMAEQQKIQALTGRAVTTQYYLVQAPDHEIALAREELLLGRLNKLQAAGVVGAVYAPAQFVPSTSRQRENARIVSEKLEVPYLTRQLSLLGMPMPEKSNSPTTQFLSLNQVVNALPMLRNLLLPDRTEGVTHVVLLESATGIGKLRLAVEGIEGISFVDPAVEITGLFGKYRRWAIALLAGSIALMVIALGMRYGFRRAGRVMVPPAAGVVLAPGLLALAGHQFSFFDAMALILVLAIGVDYAIFCAETKGPRRSQTMLAVTLATLTSLLSFGLLAFSETYAVHTFGLTMMTGIFLVFLLAPLAADRLGTSTKEAA